MLNCTLKNAWELTSGRLTAQQKDPYAKRQHSLLGEEQVLKLVGEVGSGRDSHEYQVIK